MIKFKFSAGFEQRKVKTEEFAAIYVSFGNSSDIWQIETEIIDTTGTADIEEEECFDIGRISM